MGREAPFWEEKRPNKNKTHKTRVCSLGRFGSIQSKDPPYYRGKDIYSLEISIGKKTRLPLPLWDAGII